MRVILILSLALVLLAFVAFAAPSYDPEDINKRGMEIFESFMDWKRSLPSDSDGSFRAFQRSLQQRELSADLEGGPETPLTDNEQRESLVEEQTSAPDLPKVVQASDISPANLTVLYQQWLKKVPKGRDSSFKAFLDWLEDQDDYDDYDDDHDDDHDDDDRYDRDDRDHHDDNDDHDDDHDDHDEPDDADDFGLTNDEFEALYRIWRSKNTAGKDLSYRAFVRWMQENNEPEVDEDGNPRKATYIRWGAKIGEYYKNKYGNENDENNERQLAEVEQFPSDEQQPAINRREEAAAYEYRGLAEENLERDWQEPNAAAYDGQNAAGYEFQRDMERRQGEEREGFAPARFARAESQDGFSPAPVEEATPQEGLSPAPVEEAKPQEEQQTPLPFVETEQSDTNGGYSCEENSPCNIENIVNTQYYFATSSSDQYIHCDAWGGCHTLTCDDGLAWDDQIKMCGLRS